MKTKKVPYNILQRLVMAAGKSFERSVLISLAIFAAILFPRFAEMMKFLAEKLTTDGALVVLVLSWGLLIYLLRIVDRIFVAYSGNRWNRELLLRVVYGKVVDYGNAIWKRGPGELNKVTLPSKERNSIWMGLEEKADNIKVMLGVEIKFDDIVEDFSPQEVYENIYARGFQSLDECIRNRLAGLSKFKEELAGLCKKELAEEEILNEVTSFLKPLAFLTQGFGNLKNASIKLHLARSVEAAVV